MSTNAEYRSSIVETAEILSAISKDETVCEQMDDVSSMELKLALALAELILRKAALKNAASQKTVN